MIKSLPLQLLVILTIVSQVAKAASGVNWGFDYSNNGKDWDRAIPPPGFDGTNHCGEKENQSPINLLEPIGSYGRAYGYPLSIE